MERTTKTTKKKIPAAKKPIANSDAFKKLKLLVTVVNRSKTEFFMDLLSGFEVNFQTAVLGQGTASSEARYVLGLEDSDKSVIFSVLREAKITEDSDCSHEIKRCLLLGRKVMTK